MRISLIIPMIAVALYTQPALAQTPAPDDGIGTIAVWYDADNDGVYGDEPIQASVDVVVVETTTNGGGVRHYMVRVNELGQFEMEIDDLTWYDFQSGCGRQVRILGAAMDLVRFTMVPYFDLCDKTFLPTIGGTK